MKVEKRIANAKKIFVLITVVFKIRYKNTTKNLNMQDFKQKIIVCACTSVFWGLKDFRSLYLANPRSGEFLQGRRIPNLLFFLFTRDSVILIAAKDGEATPMYKYDYRAIVFGESASEGVQVRFMGQNADLSQPAKWPIRHKLRMTGYKRKGRHLLRMGNSIFAEAEEYTIFLDWKSLVDTNDDLSYNVLIKSYDNRIIRAG